MPASATFKSLVLSYGKLELPQIVPDEKSHYYTSVGAESVGAIQAIALPLEVYCSCCEEPWDTYHIYRVAVYETALDTKEAKAWSILPRQQQLQPSYREEFRRVGWEFGRSILNVLHCPRCPIGATVNPDRAKLKELLEDQANGDDDKLMLLFEQLHFRIINRTR